MVYKTPVQLIYSVDKAIGGYITVRQFLYLAAGAALAGLFYLPFWGKWSLLTGVIVTGICEAPFAALAFLKVKETKLDDYLMGYIHFRQSPKTWPGRPERG